MNKVYRILNKIKYELVITLIFCVVILLDTITKVLFDNKNYNFIDGFISISSAHNTGGAYSIFSSHTLALIIVTIVFIAIMLIFNIFFKKKNYFYSISYGLVLSGALGNLFDRIFLGYVRDFIKLEFIDFPIFNIADCAICVGVFLLAIFLLFFAGKKEVKT